VSNLIFAFLLSLLFFSIYMGIRGEIVYKECMRLLDEADRKAKELIEKKEYEKCLKPLVRYEEKINLNRMWGEVFKFHWELDLSDL